jgi:hypothetical protein
VAQRADGGRPDPRLTIRWATIWRVESHGHRSAQVPALADIAAGFRIAGRRIAPAIRLTDDRHGPTVLVAAFVMLADILSAFGIREEELVRLARQGARMRLEQVLH